MAQGAFSIYPVDMDGDGDLDLVANDPNQGKLGWHKNEGDGRFTQQVIASLGLGRQSWRLITMPTADGR